ncbi:hypothetical protein ABZX85_01925 [Streptomyces sp. NPDC004539]|uniref:hypothetical protein n=1 Tax=Streptomyces sp. NPDC004539 TaxID=3154280 RepID=UPI00339E9A5A
MNTPDVRLASLPEPVGALLRAVHDALDIPLPEVTDADERAHASLMRQRAADARIILAFVLDEGHEVANATGTLRAWTARRPVTYTPWNDHTDTPTVDGGAA